jgi:hypothetical protein
MPIGQPSLEMTAAVLAARLRAAVSCAARVMRDWPKRRSNGSSGDVATAEWHAIATVLTISRSRERIEAPHVALQ